MHSRIQAHNPIEKWIIVIIFNTSFTLGHSSQATLNKKQTADRIVMQQQIPENAKIKKTQIDLVNNRGIVQLQSNSY